MNREILKLRRDKLRKELEATPGNVPPELPESDAPFREQLHIREVDYYFGRVERHLHDSPVRVKEIEITHMRELPAKRDPDKRGKS